MATLNLLKTPAPALEPNISQIVLLLSIFFLFLKKWANSGHFFIYFWSFPTNIITIFTTNICDKMLIQYMTPGFEPMTFRT